jgi:sec-independent protein translocase protein TatB
MFDIGWGELLVIGIVALVVIGPKELPGVLRTLGQGMTKIRRMASEFQNQFNEAMREAEMADLKKQVDDIGAAARGFADYDPLRDDPDGLRMGTPVQTEPPPAITASAKEAPTPPQPEAGHSSSEAPKTDTKTDAKPNEGPGA